MSISHEKQVVLYDQRGTRCWAVLVDLLAGAAATCSVWVVWGGRGLEGGVTIWCLVMRTYSKLAEGLEVWKKIHITRAKPLTHCVFFSYERAQLAGGSRWYQAHAPVVVISNYNNCHLSHCRHCHHHYHHCHLHHHHNHQRHWYIQCQVFENDERRK